MRSIMFLGRYRRFSSPVGKVSTCLEHNSGNNSPCFLDELPIKVLCNGCTLDSEWSSL